MSIHPDSNPWSLHYRYNTLQMEFSFSLAEETIKIHLYVGVKKLKDQVSSI